METETSPAPEPAPRKKRKVVPRLGSFAEYKESKKKPVAAPAQQPINIDSMLKQPTSVQEQPKEEPKKKK